MRHPDTPLALVVGSNPSLCRLIGDQLHAGGFACEVVPPVDKALELWRCNQHDLVILDQCAHEQSGLAICRAIRSIQYGNHTPFLLVGDEHGSDAIRELLELGSSDFVALPQVGAQLLPKARTLVKSAQTHMALTIGLEQLREAQLLARMGLWVWVPEGELLRFDENTELLFERLFCRDLSLEKFLRVVHPDDRQLVRNAFFELAWGGEHRLEYRLVGRDGQLRYVAQRGSAFLRRGEIHFNGIIQDITSQRQTADRLVMMQDALDSLPIGITITDLDGRIVYTNPAEEGLHGYDPGELLGLPASILGPGNKAPRQGKREPGQWTSWSRKGMNQRKSGEVFPVRLHSNPVRNSRGAVIGMVTASEHLAIVASSAAAASAD